MNAIPRLAACLSAMLIVFSSIGCVVRYNVDVNGYRAPSPSAALAPGAKVFVVADPNAANPLLEREVAQKIGILLEGRGYDSVPPEGADYYVVFGYTIGSGPTVTGVLPVVRPGGTATVNTYGSGGYSYSTVNLPSTTSYVPYSKTLNTRVLILRVVDARKYQATQQVDVVWAGDTVSSGSSSDLRNVLNYMLVATFEHFGQNTGKAVRHRVPASDPAATSLRDQ